VQTNTVWFVINTCNKTLHIATLAQHMAQWHPHTSLYSGVDLAGIPRRHMETD